MLPTAFDLWLEQTLAHEGPFTAFFILFEATPDTIVPIASSYIHIIGPDVQWNEIAKLMDHSGMIWHSVAVFAAKTQGGLLTDPEARRRLEVLQKAVIRDRLNVKRGELFDPSGRRLALDLLCGSDSADRGVAYE